MASLLAPTDYPVLSPLAGVRLATAKAGIKTGEKTRKDVLLVSLAPGTTVAGVFTRSLTAAAPVLRCRELLSAGKAQALIVNSGNANAFTGHAGDEAVEATTQAVATALGCPVSEVFVASTGVIGVPLPAERLVEALPELVGKLDADHWEKSAKAIMTTDAFPKYSTRQCLLDGQVVNLHGIAKGAGMIAPDMATMLAFFFTDASLSAPVLQDLLRDVTETSFNAVTVDGDTSTNDTFLLFATQGAPAGGTIRQAHDPKLADFRRALQELAQELAQMLVRDGEGATKLVKITVHEAASRTAARRIALSIANSPLVKTALAGEDPNWGRIVAAVGKSGEKASRDALWIRFGDILVAKKGRVHKDYREKDGATYFKRRELSIDVGVGIGEDCFTVWTCDLGHPYVTINADYRS